MSWIKRRPQTNTPSPAPSVPPVPMYNPNQHSNQEWQQQSQWFPQQEAVPQNYWPQQEQPPYNQNQFNQYQQVDPNQQPAQQAPVYYQQNYSQYNQQQQQYPPVAQNNLYLQQQQTAQQGGEGEWGNWGWGDEDNSNVAQTNQQPPTDNITDSFKNEESWNWPVEEQDKLSRETFPKVGTARAKLETPQWSVESQMSQESSDDVQQTSESDKNVLSRSSTISHSPVSGHDPPPIPEEHNVENKEIVAGPPLLNAPYVDDKNPYKRTGGMSHKAFRKTPPYQSFNNQTVNLETLPDNSEQPDSLPVAPARKISATNNKPLQQRPDNNEVPINDRNQYLETGQLSDVDLQDTNDTLPPPGLRRMVLGQMEQNESNGLSGDEPPPGLSRMVLGQTENAAGPNIEPPEGLRRMVPGESSSPESTSRLQQTKEDDSETEFNQINAAQQAQPPRSATIGADTPPSVLLNAQPSNRSETIGADTPPMHANLIPQDSDTVKKKKQVQDGSNGGTKDGRRDSIEGQPQEESDLTPLVNSVRNLTVGENSTDGDAKRHSSRQESSDSEQHEPRGKSPRDRRERRYKEHNERDYDRYSPEDGYKKYGSRRKYHKDRRYHEEDTDYYSDKEKERRRRDERPSERDYDKKYSSLSRKDKDRRRRNEYGREYHGRRNDYYYEEEQRSRPSSRSDSMHDPYRERHNRHRDRERRHRDPFGAYPQGFGYDPYSPYYQQYQYQYYENLRRTNPQAYAEWYRKYYQQSAGQVASGYGAEDRASVHSGRSSANDELAKDRYTRQSYYSQSSLPQMGAYYADPHSFSGRYDDSTSFTAKPYDQPDSYSEQPQRLTPAKFTTAHVRASIGSGKLIRILPHYPLDGQSATVEICKIESVLLNDDEYKELLLFPGPLIKGVTHKKTIIEYCESKIRGAAYNSGLVDTDSYVLMWELLILLIRQNGMVVGTDIAELLLKSNKEVQSKRPASVLSSISSNAAELLNNTSEAVSEQTNGSAASVLKEEEATAKFREYLLYGSCKEALEWAMKHGLWGHALFLASKLDKRTYANVMMRFANGLTMNDPLQTLYQLLSGRTPAAVTCVADEKWGDWRPHLAMILSNPTQRPELNCKAITTLGDTLLGRGSLYSAQFCYLMAEVGFSRYGTDGAKLVLLGSNHAENFKCFATNEAIHMTEIYEYACSLNDPAFALPEFQAYKYLLATRLADGGLLEKALSYLEQVGGYIVRNPTAIENSLVCNVYNLADRLKYNDPIGDDEEEEVGNEGGVATDNRPDGSWLKELRQIYDNTQFPQDVAQDPWQLQQEYQPVIEQPQQQWQPEQIDYSQQQQQQGAPLQVEGQYQSSQNYWPQQQQQQQQQSQWDPQQPNQYIPQEAEQLANNYYAQSEPGAAEGKPNEESAPPYQPPQPQVSLPNQSYDARGNEETAKSPEKPKPKPVSPEKPASTGWFGGIFSKLAPKPKNQMKLPDDKNPTIVWDPVKKRWINNDDDGPNGGADLKPPPKMADLMPKAPPEAAGSNTPGGDPSSIQQPLPLYPTNVVNPPDSYCSLDYNTANSNINQAPVDLGQPNSLINNNNNEGPKVAAPPVAQQNMFKMQQGRGRNLKKSYVDVFNPGGKPAGPQSLPGPDGFSNNPVPRQLNFFVPPPVNDPNAPTDFLTPAPPLQLPHDGSQAH